MATTGAGLQFRAAMRLIGRALAWTVAVAARCIGAVVRERVPDQSSPDRAGCDSECGSDSAQRVSIAANLHCEVILTASSYCMSRVIQLGAFAEELWCSQKSAACVCQSHSAQLPPFCVRPPLSTLSLFPASQMAAKMMGAKLGLGLGGSRLLLQQSAARSGTRRPLSVVAASTPEREVMERLPGKLPTRHPTAAVLFSSQLA